ncbi:hypothetical protein S7711_10974 [Stachybotrys chartarum IBT 7711]|uniref:Uncharacterized protein n=1 Tax=Stachybotrys chartarum (strain CBS 109288 / IBT 7711) TaxID=1280523 RepID=A0A084B1H5_STACB|nr:hypothetical protein S7711_10974 [Stachybotrys chartarum IBT 7711]KFA48146.1 hypothetical protein S40293_11319 [Stachybotrys chartarum IBT 40293]KFA75120.1 hypothetical protein S40288_10866 [Stachybotrys chartarum IBT 40288]
MATASFSSSVLEQGRLASRHPHGFLAVDFEAFATSRLEGPGSERISNATANSGDWDSGPGERQSGKRVKGSDLQGKPLGNRRYPSLGWNPRCMSPCTLCGRRSGVRATMLLRFKPSNARPARSSPIFTPHSQPKPSKRASRDAQSVCANASHSKLCYVGEDARRPQPKSWRWRVRRKRLPFLGLIRPLYRKMAPAR